MCHHVGWLLFCSDGKSRCFGFVGFARAPDAQAAQKYYNRTFLDAMRLEVEFAQKYGSDVKRNAWSKYTEGTSRNKEFMAATGANAVAVVQQSAKGKVVPTGGTAQGAVDFFFFFDTYMCIAI